MFQSQGDVKTHKQDQKGLLAPQGANCTNHVPYWNKAQKGAHQALHTYLNGLELPNGSAQKCHHWTTHHCQSCEACNECTNPSRGPL